MHKTILTFDIEGLPGREDFLLQEEIGIFTRLLRLLEKYQLKSLFFIPGTIAEKLVSYPEVLELFGAHEIGYHSSSHSIKPRNFEYTDVKSYERAVQVSFEREISRVNQFNGKIEGEGGIQRLREIFPEKDIISFRAPFWCWSPPQLEALRELGIKNDFSNVGISIVPLFYKGLIFFPESIPIDNFQDSIVFFLQEILFRRASKEEITIFLMHPATILGKPKSALHKAWYSDPFCPFQIKLRKPIEIESGFVRLELFLSSFSLLQIARLIEVDPSVNLDYQVPNLDPKMVNVEKIYQKSISAPVKLFGHNPKYLRSHFHHFFERE